MARRARRYDGEQKLNVKKIIAVIVLLLVVVMFFIGIKSLLKTHSESTSGKIETLNYYTVYDNGKWGVINSYGKSVIEAEYDEMIVIPDSTKAIFICTYDIDYSQGTYKTKAVNSKNKDIVTGYDQVEAITNYDKNQNLWYEQNVLRVQKDGKYGLVDYDGEEILPCEYEKIEAIQGIKNSLIITKDGKQGLSDDLGNVIIEPKYKKIEKIEEDYKNGYIVVNEEDKYGIIGYDKAEILPCQYEEVKGIYSEDIFIVKKDGKYIAIDKEGNTILENKFDDAMDIEGEYIAVKKGGKAGVIDKNGETKVKFEYDELTFANSKFCIGLKNDKYGIVDIEGTEKIGFEYIDMNYVKTGDFIVADYLSDNKLVSKVFDSNFEEKINGTVSEVNTAKGYIKVNTNDEYKYYNFKFEEIESSSVLNANKLFLSKKDGKYGFVDASGKVVVDYIYDDATEQNVSGYAGVKKDGLWGSIDINGKVVIEPEYNLDNNTKIDFIGAWHICEDKNANYYIDV